MAPSIWREAEIAYRTEKIATDFARARRPRTGRSGPAVRASAPETRPALRRLGQALHLTSL